MQLVIQLSLAMIGAFVLKMKITGYAKVILPITSAAKNIPAVPESIREHPCVIGLQPNPGVVMFTAVFHPVILTRVFIVHPQVRWSQKPISMTGSTLHWIFKMIMISSGIRFWPWDFWRIRSRSCSTA